MVSKAPTLQDLRARITKFFSREVRVRRPLCRLLELISDQSEQAYFFGGFLRDLMVTHGPISPRDIDVVVDVDSFGRIVESLEDKILRRNSFGGLVVSCSGWRLDIWPIEETWAFRTHQVSSRTIADLPSTTFLNIEAIVAEVGTSRGRVRRVFDGGFLKALRERTLDINLRANPLPDLALVRALVLAANLDFQLSPALIRYTVSRADKTSLMALTEVQLAHYGAIRQFEAQMASWLDYLCEHQARSPDEPARLPRQNQQLTLWGTTKLDTLEHKSEVGLQGLY